VYKSSQCKLQSPEQCYSLSKASTEQELPLENLKKALCLTPQPAAAPYTSTGTSKSDAGGSS